MFDFDFTQALCFLLICLVWIVSYVFVVYDLITFFSRTNRPSKIWRGVFESAILIGAGFVWLNLGDEWSLENNLWRSVAPVTGALVLLAYLYSSYRRRVAALWLEVIVQICLVVGVLGIVGFTLMTRFFWIFIIVAIPSCIVLTMALFTDYHRSGPQKMD